MQELSKPLIIFDLETTGVNPVKDRIVQIAALKIWADGTEEKKETLVNPGIEIPKEASDVHGITNEMVETAPTFKQISKSLFAFFEDCDIAGYNSDSFDVPMLIEEFYREGIVFPGNPNTCFYDFFKAEMKIYSRQLGEAYKRYTGKNLEDAHDAMNDVIGTKEVMLGQMLKTGLKTIEELKEYYQEEGQQNFDFAGKMYVKDGEVYFSFGKHKDQKVKENISYANWMLSGDFPRDTKNKIRELIG